MGTWGEGIFDDDDAADVRESFVHYVADAQDVAAATDAAVLDFGALFERPLDNPSFWLALALTQWRNGWLDPRVRQAAFAVMDDQPWVSVFRVRARQAEKLRQQLRSESRPARKFPKPWPTQLADFSVGEIIGYRLRSGKLTIGKVIGFRSIQELNVRGPAIRLQKWISSDMPSALQALDLDYLRLPIGPNRVQTIGAPVLTAPRSRPLDPSLFIRPGFIVPLREREDKCSWFCVSNWANYSIDDIFETAIERWWDDPNLPAAAFPPWYKPPTT